MFTPEQRARIRDRLIELARDDDRIVGAAITGSGSHGADDEWSDVDLFFGVREGLDHVAVLENWTAMLYRDFGALHHFEERAEPAVYHAVLLADCLEIDLGFTPAAHFGARRPTFHLLFGEPVSLEHVMPPNVDHEAGLAWHHVLHARSAIERGKRWQAEYWIGALRDHALAIACVRLGLPAVYAKGVDSLPREVTAPFEGALIGSLEGEELRRALRAAARGFLEELARSLPELEDRLAAPIVELADLETSGR